MQNNKLLEQPDHGHYTACCQRMHSIEKLSRLTMIVTLTLLPIMFIASLCSIDLSIISFLPMCTGCPFSVAYLFIMTAQLIGMAVLAVLGCAEKKICHVILFAIYSLMIVHQLITTVYLFPMAIALIGAASSIFSISIMSDYKQLEETEGFPSFTERAAESREFRSQYSREYYSSKNTENIEMPQADKAVPQPGFSHSSSEMPELDFD